MAGTVARRRAAKSIPGRSATRAGLERALRPLGLNAQPSEPMPACGHTTFACGRPGGPPGGPPDELRSLALVERGDVRVGAGVEPGRVGIPDPHVHGGQVRVPEGELRVAVRSRLRAG